VIPPAGDFDIMVRPALFAFVLAAALAGSPAAAAQFSLSPDDTTVTVGDTFTLRVVCDAVTDLKGLQTAWAYPPTRLQLQSMTAGNVLTDAGGDWFEFVLPDVVAPADTAWMDAAMLDGSTQGPGVVAYLQFKALIEGDAPIACAFAEMRDSFNVSLAPTCAGGVVHVLGPVPAERRSWGRIKALYR
jgi:hypothetical protein